MRLTRRAALGAFAAFLPGAARARIYADTVDMVGESLDEIRVKGRLKVAVYDDFAPFSAARDGELAGIDCDIARFLAEKLGLLPELSLGPGRGYGRGRPAPSCLARRSRRSLGR